MSGIIINDLPSKFKCYPEGTKISIRPYTLGELLDNPIREGEKLRQVFNYVSTGITTEGISVSELVYADYLYLSVLRKLLTFEESKFMLLFQCSKDNCKTPQDATVLLEHVNFDELSIPTGSISTIIGEDSYVFRPLTVNDAIILDEIEKPSKLDELMLMSGSNSQESKLKLANVTDSKDIQVLTKIRQLLSFTNNTVECKCKKCSGITKMGVSSLTELAVPFRQSEESIRDRLSFI